MVALNEVIGRSQPFVKVMPPPIIAQRAPASTDTNYPKGQSWIDESVSPSVLYQHMGGGTWDEGGVADATTTTAGIVKINTDTTLAGADNTTVPTSLAIKTYADNLAIAGAPVASDSVLGLVKTVSDANALARIANSGAVAYCVSPENLDAILASPSAIGGTSPAAGTFTTLAATGAVDFDAGGSWESGGATIDIGADASADAINVGTGAAARTITIGNATGATAVAITAGTGSLALSSTGTGDITIDSDDTLLLDADGVLELNSSAGAISIGNDANAQAINIGTGAAARTITVGNSTGATSLVLNCGTGALDIGTNAIAHTVTIGNVTGATAVAINVGTGNFAVDGVAASTYNIGASTTTGTVTIGGTSQTGNFVLAPSDGTMTATLANSNGAKTINIGNGITGNTISVGNGANSSAQIINVANGASAANSTVNVLSGNGTAGTQTLNILAGTRAGALNLATGAAAHVIAVGSASAGAVTVDTAAGISLDSATASNFTVTGAADLTLDSSAGSVNIAGGEAASDAVSIQAAAGGIDIDGVLQINIASAQAAADAIRINASDAAGGIDIDDAGGGITLDSAGAISLDAAAASNFSVSGAGVDLNFASAAGRVIVTSGEDAADTIYLHADAGTSEKIRIHADQGTGTDSIELESDDGGITLTSTALADAAAINIDSVAGGVDVDAALQINIASSQAAATAIVLNASDASGGIQLSGAGGVNITNANLKLSGAATQLQVEGGAATDFIGTATLSSGTVTVSNTNIAATDRIFIQRQSVNSSSAIGELTYSISAGASFTVTSVQAASPGSTQTNDNSIFMYFIVRQL